MTNTSRIVLAIGALPIAFSAPCAQLTRGRTAAAISITRLGFITDPDAKVISDPDLIVAMSDGFAVLDTKPLRLVKFGSHGAFQWSYGRLGSGPGELRSVSDLQPDAAGNVWIADRGNGRIAVVSPKGQLIQEVRTENPLARIAPFSLSTGFISAADLKGQILARVDSSGRRSAYLSAPAGIDTMSILTRDHQLVGLGPGNFALYFHWASRIIAFRENGSVAFDLAGPDSIPFPAVKTIQLDAEGKNFAMQVDPAAPEVTLSATATSATLMILGAKADRAGHSIVDCYSSDNGRYVGSFILDVRATRIAATDGHLYAVVDEPEPGIVRYALKKK